jgi:hypothetical protein
MIFIIESIYNKCYLINYTIKRTEQTEWSEQSVADVRLWAAASKASNEAVRELRDAAGEAQSKCIYDRPGYNVAQVFEIEIRIQALADNCCTSKNK